MTNLLATSYYTANVLRRELEDVFEEFPVPFRMRRDVERVLEQPATPMWLWRVMDQILDEYMAPPVLRRRVERSFERVLSSQRAAMARDAYFGGIPDTFGRSFGDGYLRNSGDGYLRGFGDGTIRTTGDAFLRGFGDGFARTTGDHRSFGDGYFYGPGETHFRDINDLSLRGIGDLYWRGTSDRYLTGLGDAAFVNGRDPYFRNIGEYARTFGDSFAPSVDVIERDQDIIVRVDLPGVRDQDIDTRITEDNVLTIRARRPGGVVARSVPLPRGLITSAIQAVFRFGVLEVRVPRAEIQRSRRIPVVRETGEPIFRTNGAAEQRVHLS